MRLYSRDLTDPRNLIHAARKAVGLEVIENPRYPGSYVSPTRYPATMTRMGRLPDGRRVRLLASVPRRSGRSRSAPHRLQVECPECRQWIPVGRWSQHCGKRSCGVARTSYERREQQGQGRSIMQLRRLAYKARSSSAARAVLHDALLEAFPRTYPMFIRKAERESRKKETGALSRHRGERTARYVAFLARNLRYRRAYDENMFFSVWHPDWGQYLEPPDVFVYSTTGVVPMMPVLPRK
jgi:hypothetical protein